MNPREFFISMRSQFLLLALSRVLVSQSVRGAESPADLVLLNGRIVTVDPRSSLVEAAGHSSLATVIGGKVVHDAVCGEPVVFTMTLNPCCSR